MAVSSATAFDVMSSPESIQICKDWRSVTSECECSTTIASVASSERVAASFPSSAAGDDETPRSGAGQPETRKQVPKDLERCIIFDWDDTLLPSSFIEDAARMCAPNYSSGRRRAGRAARQVPQLPADFPCYAAIKEHGQLIAKVLRLAKQCGDRVAIVSLSERPWVFESADQYLPGLDMAELLKELQIPVYYASEHTRTPTSTAWGELPEEEDLHVLTKRNAMLEFLQASQGPQTGLHLISIGDSLVEKEAAQACARLADLQTASLCKTIKLIGDPSLKQLTEQLQTLAMHLPSICAYESDLDLHAQSPDDLVSQLATVGPDP
ncbi:unnamed protein product [Durusdinium trenchii]